MDATVDPSRSHTAGLQTVESENRQSEIEILASHFDQNEVWITILKHQSTLKHMEVSREEEEVIKKTPYPKKDLLES